MKSKKSCFTLAAWFIALVLGPAGAGLAQTDAGAGLLGQTYSGIEFGYTHHVEAAPRALHRYGFVSSRPLVEKENVDAAFLYNYTRGSAFGLGGQQHDLAMAFTGFLPHPEARPFARAELGWVWTRLGGIRESSFAYKVGVGVELPLSARVAVAPFVNYREITQAHDRGFQFGVRGHYRMNRLWHATLTFTADDAHNLDYAAGVQRRF